MPRGHFISQRRGRNRWKHWDSPRFTNKAAASKLQSDNGEKEGETEIDTAYTNVSIAHARDASKPLLCDKGDNVESNTLLQAMLKII
jgi:hypothetical protein